MTPPAPTTHESDEDYEAEVRAMLARRATDVSPTRPRTSTFLLPAPAAAEAVNSTCTASASGTHRYVTPSGKVVLRNFVSLISLDSAVAA